VTREDFRRQADAVRSIPLETVLARWGAERDRRDRAQWHTELGPLSVTGTKFFNWHLDQGGGGAIDLVMHLGRMDYRTAVKWLQQHLGSAPAPLISNANSPCNNGPRPSFPCGGRATQARKPLRLPVADPTNLQRVRRYLTEQRSLAAHILEPLIEAGRIYADQRGNSVFVMVAGKAHRPIGAELRGTGQQVWRGLAPGTRKDEGYFWIGVPGGKRVVLCESAIDAISCFQLQCRQPPANCICISTAGIRPDAPWLPPLIARGYDIYCGFDDDEPGNAASRQMISRHPVIERLRPPAHDWNDALTAGS
jgi:Protein of unknown function (DUF3991)/Toprim-like